MKTYIIYNQSMNQQIINKCNINLAIVRIDDNLKLASFLADNTFFEVITPLNYAQTVKMLKALLA